MPAKFTICASVTTNPGVRYSSPIRTSPSRSRALMTCHFEKMKEESCGVYRSEEHTSELQSLMRISYAVFCLKKKKLIRYSTLSIQIVCSSQNHTSHCSIITYTSTLTST